MANVDEFLKQNPALELDESISDRDLDGVRIEGKIIGISSKHVKFSHLGTDYMIAKENVLDIAERVDPTASGKIVTLTLARDTNMLASYSVTAAELASSLPFSLARPSSVPTRRFGPSPREIAWRQAARYSYNSEYPSREIYLDPLSHQTLTACDSYSNGQPVDTIPCDERADY